MASPLVEAKDFTYAHSASLIRQLGGPKVAWDIINGKVRFRLEPIEPASPPAAKVEVDLLQELFISPEAQIARWREWNKEFKLGVTEEVFDQLAASVPAEPQGRLVARVLVYHFASPQKELEFYWPLIARGQDENWKWDQLLFDSDHLRWLKGYENIPGLKWHVIDLGADCGRKPCDVRHPQKSPGVSGLSAAALFPDWIRAMDGSKVPYIWLPGYEVSIPVNDPWRLVPGVGFGGGYRGV